MTASTTAAPTLPLDLAPDLLARLTTLLAGVTVTAAPPIVVDVLYRGPRCVVCHDGGKLGGHHGDDGRIEWIHRKCHRRLHRRDLPRGQAGTGQRVLQRRRRTAC